ncbi:MAG: TonB-dependent receptor [Flavobacteriia bacterium]|nr:MAG: TonB-dependent receptor [Flavobacteriia bacterium]
MFLVLGVLAQDNGADIPTYTIKGKITDGETKNPMIHTHIINLNRVTATMTSSTGHYKIKVNENDTLYFSYVGYQSIKLRVTKDILKGNDLDVVMYEVPIELGEVRIKPYQLIGVLEVDSKHVPVNKYEHVEIAGLPQTYQTGEPVAHVYDTPLDAVFHPIDYLYEMFGSKPKQLRRLKKLRSQDQLREILETKANREVLMEYLKMDREQLNSLLNYCNYSEYFIRNASDLQVIEAVLDCYENYKAVHSGSTKSDRIKN